MQALAGAVDGAAVGAAVGAGALASSLQRAPGDDRLGRERLSEEVRAAFDYLPATIAGNVAGMVVIAALYAKVVAPAVLSAWLACFVVMLGVRALMGLRFRATWQAARQSEHAALAMDWPRWRLGWNIGTLVSGALWGMTAWIFMGRGDANQQTALVITIYTFCIAAVPVLATQPKVYAAFAALCFVPLVARLVLEATQHSLELAGILLLLFSLTSVLARSFRNTVTRAVDLKLSADHLAVQLRAERESAEQARADAEAASRRADAANLAKTQFFAAASHDLRQPLHAMGLFAEALSQRRHDQPTQALVTSIQGSVDALEALFSQLMDINRIDAGIVQAEPVGVRLQGVFDKLAVHLAPEAFDKGLALRWRGGQHVVHADPLLLERVLRNLVGNALRYTADGGVLVGARPRDGWIELQVWDTGVGIAPAEQDRVFDEFYQVRSSGAAPVAGQVSSGSKKGLGLGLAIVRRLCAVMGVSVSLRSVPARGTVMTVRLPAGRCLPVAEPRVEPRSASFSGLAGRRVLVLDDEADVRASLLAVLSAWGAQVEALASVQALSDWLATPASPGIDLAILDYRLQGEATGLDALSLLRRKWPDLPALIVSGSTHTVVEAAARSAAVPLLHKPLMPARLRAAISAVMPPSATAAEAAFSGPQAS